VLAISAYFNQVFKTMKNTMRHYPLLALLLLLGVDTNGQDRFDLKNPSFEKDKPGAGNGATDWIDLGAPMETPPDIQPGQFGVTMAPQHGKVYLGLVVRDNNTWEGVGQRLNGFLQKDSAYTFSVWLARSNSFLSMSKTTGQEAKYNNPTVLKIWGVNSQTQEEELLAESIPVSHSQWTNYAFTLRPSVADFDEINLMAYYAPGFEQKNGNLLIDNCSPIVKITE
jgi:hypothetical protein